MATAINEEMKMAAVRALAQLAREDVPETVSRAYGGRQFKFGREYLIPKGKHVSVQEGDFVMKIQDNGAGIPAELDGRLDRGHGMSSMKSRAKQMQGQCLVESGPGWGTVIRLTIPL